MQHHPIIIIGSGPGGLTAAHQLAQQGVRPLVLEKADKVGGIARTEIYRGYRFDVGGHRFFTRSERVRRMWEEMLGADLRQVSRLSRIHFRGRLFKYPLDLVDAVSKLGAPESALMLLSYVRAKLRRHPVEETFEQWVTNRFGARLYRTFFQAYTEKVWGMPCSAIRADWAAQRIGGLSVTSAVRNTLLGTNGARTLIREFQYPVLGPGMMWEGFARSVGAHGGEVRLHAEVVGLTCREGRVASVTVRQGDDLLEIAAERVISSMPLAELIVRLRPPPPPDVLRAAKGLRYRAFVLVGLIVNRRDLFPDHWIYVHDPGVRAARIQNFKNWSPAMVADPRKTCLGVEYFCSAGDEIWTMGDNELLALAAGELERLRLVEPRDVEDGTVIRQPMAYPVYDRRYRENLHVLRPFLAGIANLQTIGRNGLHRYNNMDHSMLTGALAAENVLGAGHDLWELNHGQEYLEQR